jgi:hypothetical protein
MSTPASMSRREKIETLLEHLVDYFVISGAGGYDPSGGGNAGFLPKMSRHPSVLELRRCLDKLAVYAPAEYGQLKAYYTCEWRTARVKKQTLVPANTAHTYAPDLKMYLYRERVLPRWVRLAAVERAVGWVAGDEKAGRPPSVTVRFRGEPFIPSELLEPIRESAA